MSPWKWTRTTRKGLPSERPQRVNKKSPNHYHSGMNTSKQVLEGRLHRVKQKSLEEPRWCCNCYNRYFGPSAVAKIIAQKLTNESLPMLLPLPKSQQNSRNTEMTLAVQPGEVTVEVNMNNNVKSTKRAQITNNNKVKSARVATPKRKPKEPKSVRQWHEH